MGITVEGLKRHLCKACEKTFNDKTGTRLHYSRPELTPRTKLHDHVQSGGEAHTQPQEAGRGIWGEMSRCWLSLRSMYETAEGLKAMLGQLPEVKAFKRFISRANSNWRYLTKGLREAFSGLLASSWSSWKALLSRYLFLRINRNQLDSNRFPVGI